MEPWLRDNIANLERKRDYLVDRLNRIPGIRCNTPKGCYFTFPDVRGLGMPTFQLAEHLLRRGRVSVAPGFEFGPKGEGHLRVSFCFSMLVNGIKDKDFPVVQAGILVAAASYVLANLLVDLSYGWLDPRIRLDRKAT